MNLSAIKKKLGKIDWYKQGVEARYIYVGYPWIAMNELTVFGRRIPVVYDTIVCHAKRNNMSWYWSKDSLRNVAGYFYGKQKCDHRFIRKLVKNWRDDPVKKLLVSVSKIEKIDFQKLSKAKFVGEFDLFSKTYMNFWRESALHDAFDIGAEEILKNAVERERKKISDEDINLLTAMTELSWPQKERKEFLRLVNLAKKNKNWKKMESISEKIKKHAEKYHWILNHYAGSQRLEKRYFESDIKQYLKDGKKYHGDEEIVKHVSIVKKEKDELIKKLRLSKKFLADLDFLITLAKWRDERKVYVQMAAAVITKFSREFSRRTKLSLDIVENLFWPELLNLFKNKDRCKRLSQKRYRGVIMLDYVRYGKGIYGRDSDKLHAFFEELISGGKKEVRGRSAYPGLVRGIAKIIKSPSEFGRMKKGDILVAPNTRPEYFPIMKIAGGIVTEEGGLTCHAAIVSRELRVPCVVGAQGILSVVKGGNLVEVDANKGIIRKI